MMTGLLMLIKGGGTCGVGRMLGGGGGSGATTPSRRVRRDWMASTLLGGASWMPAMAAVSLSVASMILSLDWKVLMIPLLPVLAMRT